jgi:hypothetical protein
MNHYQEVIAIQHHASLNKHKWKKHAYIKLGSRYATNKGGLPWVACP